MEHRLFVEEGSQKDITFNVSPFKLDLYFMPIKPAAEKALSDSTLVGQTVEIHF